MYRKIIVTKGVIEVYEYERLNVNQIPDRDGDGEYHEKNYKQRQRDRRNAIRRLICQNFDSESKFITLTFRDTETFDIKDVKSCNHQYKRFVDRLRRRFQALRYVAVIEFQDKNGRGAIHYHMVCNLPYISKAELARLWGHGFVKINAIDKVDNVGAYVIKYMTSDMDDKRLCGENAYLRSRGLETPVEVRSWREGEYEAVRGIEAMLAGKTPSYGGEPYESEHAGTIRYSQYNLNRIDGQEQNMGVKTA